MKYRDDMSDSPYQFCAGVDEVGRGPLAGPVLAAAVILDRDNPVQGLADSKKLSAARREALDVEIRAKAIAFNIARAEVEEIDALNILGATMLAMQRAVKGLRQSPDYVLVDGNRTPDFGCPADFMIKGDSRFDGIKAASIIAKVARDREMVQMEALYPGYGLARHKGYPTRQHLEALQRLGPTAIHRMSFGPCQQFALASTPDDR